MVAAAGYSVVEFIKQSCFAGFFAPNFAGKSSFYTMLICTVVFIRKTASLLLLLSQVLATI